MPSLRPLALAAAVLLAVGQPTSSWAQGPAPDGDLHGVLHIRPNQEGAYKAYQAAGPTPDELAQFRRAQALNTLNTPQRLDELGTILSLQLTVFRRKADATRALYNVLSPDQQHTFDQVTAPPSRGAPRG